MRVLLVGADSGGCSFYRMQEPARVVGEQYDTEVEVRPYLDVDATMNTQTREITVHEVKEDVDLIIFQRPLDQKLTSAIKQAKKQGIATIVEIDDDFANVHPANIAYRNMQPEHSKTSNYTWVQRAAETADLVTVSTPALEYYAPHKRVRVLRNCVPQSALLIEKVDSTKTRVGWTGTLQTHPYDLQETRGRVVRALDGSRASLYVVGDGKGVGRALGLPQTDVEASGWVPLDDYYDTIASMIDIGIVPLQDIKFNKAKSWLKGLEYAALGVPFVASPTPEYRLLEVNGIGKTVKSPGGWQKTIRRWIDDPQRRRADGDKYRSIVAERFTYEKNAHLWYSAWCEAINIRKS